jgi:hypothetical protein
MLPIGSVGIAMAASLPRRNSQAIGRKVESPALACPLAFALAQNCIGYGHPAR